MHTTALNFQRLKEEKKPSQTTFLPVFGESTTSKKDNEQNTGLFTIGKPSDGKPGEKNKDNTSKSTNNNRVVTREFAANFTLLETPWRSVNWTSESREELMEKVQSYKPASEAVSEARVLLLGPIGAGKSSFISSVQSVFSGRVINRAMVGSSASTSFTKKLQSFPIRRSGERSDPTALVLCDIMGIGEGDSTGLSLYDALCVIKGHVLEGHQFVAEQPVTFDTMSIIKKPSLKDKIHCVVFVVDASKINSYAKGLSTTFQQLRQNISSLGVHQVALLTHVDEACIDTSRDVSQVYKSRSIQQLMVKAGKLLGMATSYIVPVKNYSFQLELDDNTDILLLNAVDHILQYTDLYFKDTAVDYKVAN
ncbi:interferon-induced protein 44 isoform X1 [Pangasianodon hypophthalmus]|uniref:interferon-induced protein 44 isoform X1 n=1 Tax=Pangasianodon hypophthalmus TaxID=310915 RepID=UPI0023076A8F|nr:interferon-induced protein 44 isoform X1 [Pangasianodon hypophthalmus]XP_053094120.1 interferon-induced protein 44 isoform X1 [Pangasianodon hypophthalmus]